MFTVKCINSTAQYTNPGRKMHQDKLIQILFLYLLFFFFLKIEIIFSPVNRPFCLVELNLWCEPHKRL